MRYHRVLLGFLLLAVLAGILLLSGCSWIYNWFPDRGLSPQKQQSGVVVLPPGAVTKVEDLAVVTTFGEQRLTSDGRFTVPVSSDSTQIIFVLNTDGAPVLLGVSTGATRDMLTIDVHSTALALAFLCPLFAVADGVEAQKALNLLESLPGLSTLELAVAEHVKNGGSLYAPSSEIISALNLVIEEGVRALQLTRTEGEVGAQGVFPDYPQSGVRVETLSDLSLANLQLRVSNYGKRWVEVWYVPVGNNGQSLADPTPVPVPPWNHGLIESAPSTSFGSIVTGKVLGPAEADVTISVTRTDAVAVQLEVWGPGFSDWSSVTFSEYISRAKFSTFFTIVDEIIAQVFDIIVGIKILTRGPGRPTNTFRCLQGLADLDDIGKYLVAMVTGLARGDTRKVVSTCIDILLFLIRDPRAHQALLCLGQNIPASLINSLLTAAQRKFLGGIMLIFKAFDFGRFIGTLVAARPREVFLVTPVLPTPSPEIAAKIISYSVSPREVTVPGDTTLAVTIENTGNVADATFYVGAKLQRPDGTGVSLPLKSLVLDPGERGSASWIHTIDAEGYWDLLFEIWAEPTQERLLDYQWLEDYIVGRIVIPARWELWGEDSASNLLKIDPNTGAGTLIGSIGFEGVTDIAFTPDGRLYGIAFNQLLQIDPDTGRGTAIGGPGLCIGIPFEEDINALESLSDGRLLAASHRGNLFIIDPITGCATIVGNLGFGSSGDLAFSPDGRLFASGYGHPDILYLVDLNERVSIPIGPIGYDEVYGLAFSPDGRLYGVSSIGPKLLEIDLSTGRAREIGTITNTNGSLWGLTAMPSSPPPPPPPP